MYFLVDFIRELIGIFRATAPWLLFGFLLAGFLRVLIPDRWLQQHLGKNNLRSVFLASLAGIPLPLCSCSVLPAAAALRKGGASKSATISFTTSTPQTGVDSISLTYALMDPLMTVARPLIAFVTALSTGVMVNVMGTGRSDGRSNGSSPETDADTRDNQSSRSSIENHGVVGKIKAALAYAYGELLNDIAPWLIGGMIITALIGAIVPDGALENPTFSGFPAMLLMLVISIPLYVCATGSTPMAAMLILKGLSPGAAIVFLMAGPATNVTSLAVLTKILGRRVVIIYTLSIAFFSLLAGMLVDWLYRQGDITPIALSSNRSEFISPWLEVPLTLLLFALLWRCARQINLAQSWGEGLSRFSRFLGLNPGHSVIKAIPVLIILILYGLTGFSVLNPGETGWVITFGRMSRTIEKPGVVFHWPYPISRLEREQTGCTLSLHRGSRPSDKTPHGSGLVTFTDEYEFTREAEVLTGDENILVIQYCVHYKISDPFAYHFRLKDPEQILGGFAEFNLRRVLCEMETDSILVANRLTLQSNITNCLERELITLGLGMSILRLDLLDVHAAPAVRFAFRDVASAMEDQHRYIRQAESYRNSTIAAARGRGERLTRDAEIYKLMRLTQAQNDAIAFSALAEASSDQRQLTRMRLSLEATGRTLSKVKTVIPLINKPLDLWLNTTEKTSSWSPPWQENSNQTTGANNRAVRGETDLFIRGNLPALPQATSPGTDPNNVIPDQGTDWRGKLRRLQEMNR